MDVHDLVTTFQRPEALAERWNHAQLAIAACRLGICIEPLDCVPDGDCPTPADVLDPESCEQDETNECGLTVIRCFTKSWAVYYFDGDNLVSLRVTNDVNVYCESYEGAEDGVPWAWLGTPPPEECQ